MIVDFHTHVFSPHVCSNREEYLIKEPFFGTLYGNPKTKLVTVDELIVSMDTAGIDVSVVSGFGWMEQAQCEAENDHLLEAMRRFPGRLVGLCAAQPNAGARAVAEVRRCLRAGMAGVGELMPDGQGYSLNEFDVMDPIIGVIREYRSIILTHTSEPVGHNYPGKGRTTPEITLEFASRFSDIPIVCAHWGGGLPFYHLIPEVEETLTNVYYDTAASFLVYRPDIFQCLPPIVGPEKILFGTDYPLLSQSRFIRRVTALGLPDRVLRLILGENARQLLSL